MMLGKVLSYFPLSLTFWILLSSSSADDQPSKPNKKGTQRKDWGIMNDES